LPPDTYFQNVADLFQKIEGIDRVLEDASVTSVRLVTNPEKMVLRETQRAFVYFSLNGLTVDDVIVNRVIPDEVHDDFFVHWRESQRRTLAEIEQYFAPVPTRKVPLFRDEVLGYDRLRELSQHLYQPAEDPSIVRRRSAPYTFVRGEHGHEVRLDLPFTEKREVGLFKKNDELVVEIGTIRRHVGLPTTMASLIPVRARFDGRMLIVELKEAAA
jgi:arsenite-transporting ATPase